ncbi:SRPBCC family protein [Leekyejoonella antrihumi]|uniref:SRPBCC family protein n=1 Tax=Leekyejoonella antrihumi TaxID=1660198 RepID=A0A563E0N0_9MICO|nr:SRPBCC family protein [Leekyejoonella antrihumi]TWP36100.1 SRPBCC family protein [Leekyejoonella antrihumi]
MSETPVHTHEQSIVVEATPEALYDLVSDIARTGEWSPVCTWCRWDDAAQAGQVGAGFTGHNELPDRTWDTKSRVVAADRGREFAWVVGGSFARWGFSFAPDGAATRLTESWQFLPGGIAMFGEKYGDQAAAEIDERIRLAHDGIPRTLAAIKRVAETA